MSKDSRYELGGLIEEMFKLGKPILWRYRLA